MIRQNDTDREKFMGESWNKQENKLFGGPADPDRFGMGVEPFCIRDCLDHITYRLQASPIDDLDG